MRHVLFLIACATIAPVLTGCGGPVEPTLSAEDDGSMTVFQAASDPAAADLLEAILASGTDPNAKDESGLTPLHYAVLADNGPAVRILLGADADPDIPDPQGWTARDVAEQDQKRSALQAFDRFETLR